ncbi:MAG: YqgE/AlgH family protein [Bacteroidota bacterium]
MSGLIPGNIEPGQGKLLIAEPFLKDTYFRRTVVLLAAHNEEGSFGFILNKELEISLCELIKDLPDVKTKVFLGGPVQRDNLFYIHSLGDIVENSVEIGGGIYWGGDFETIKSLIRRNEVSRKQVRFFIGYSGWSPGQLDEELKERSWIISDLDKKRVLESRHKDLWKNALKDMGSEYAQFANYPEDPQLN